MLLRYVLVNVTVIF